MKKLLLAITAIVIVAVLSACGAKSENTGSNAPAAAASGSAAKEVKIEASNWKFDQAEYKVKKGEPVKITLVNKSGVHGLGIKDLGVDLAAGKSTTLTPNKEGSYDIVCTIPCGSSDQHVGMKAKLIVE